MGRDNSVGNHLRAAESGDRIPVGARFSAPVLSGPGAHLASHKMGTGYLPRGVKRQGRGVNHPPYLAPRLEKEKSYTSTPPLGLYVLF